MHDGYWQRNEILIPYPIKKINIEATFFSGRVRIWVTPDDSQSQCHYSCQQCQKDQPNICKSCYSDRDLVQGKCNCRQGYDVYFYSQCLSDEQINNQNCQYASCQRCNPTSSGLNCSQCDSKLNRILNNQKKTCDCIDGFYEKQGFPSCQQCSQNCLTCLGYEITCLSCDTKKLRQLNNQTNKCDCEPGYFSKQDFDICQKCSENCLTCESTDSQCTSCKDGYFLNKINNQCQKCNSPCLNCIDQNKCTSCIKGDKFVFIESSNICQCQDGYYQDQSTCKYCPLTCTKCSNNSLCTQCIQTTFLQPDGTCQCPERQIFNTQINQCQSCNPDEIICLDKDNQNQPKCANGEQYTLNPISKICQCNLGYYQDGPRCVKCPIECAECQSNLQCMKCTDPNANVNEGKCNCAEGKFFDQIQRVCINCINNCQVCSDTTSCQTCFDQIRYHLEEKTRTCICKDGYYMLNNKCEKCDNECLTCSSKQICQKCVDNSKNPGEGACRCSIGYAYDFTKQICQKCKQGCSVCNQDEECLSCVNDPAYHLVNKQCICQDGYYLDQESSTCLKCSPMCKTCTNDSTCTDCMYPTETQLFESQPGICSCIKENSFFDANDKICKPCQKNCKKCLSNTICLECVNNTQFKLENNQCFCNDGYYLYERFMICLLNCNDKFIIKDKCVDKCPPELKIVDNKQCKNECPSDYIAINQVCTRTYCDKNCINCDRDQIHCIKCNEGYQLMKDTKCKQCNKVKQFYDEYSQSCQDCDISCNSCRGMTNKDCNNCNFAKNPYKNNICVLQCDKFQEAKINPKTQENECAYCYKLDGQCLEKCPSGYYFDNQLNCIKCHSSCLECQGPLQTDCIFCNGNDYLQYSGKCTTCPYQMFLNTATKSCQLCHYSCLSCNGPTSQDCTECESSLKLSSISQQCISSGDFQKEQKELQKQKQFQCLSQDYFQCDKEMQRAKQIKSLQNLISATSISSSIFISILIPDLKLIIWQHVQNMQSIGNLQSISDAFPQFFKDYYLQLNRNYNIIPMIQDSKDNNQSSNEEFNTKQNFTSSNRLDEPQKQQDQINKNARILFLFLDDKTKLFYSTCMIQIGILYFSLIIIPIMYLIEQKSKIIQKIYTYFKWNFIINIFMAFLNEIFSNIFAQIKYIDFSEKQGIIDFFFMISTVLIYLCIQISILVFLISTKYLQSGALRLSYKCIIYLIKEDSIIKRLFYPIYEIKKLSLIILIHFFQSQSNIILYGFLSLNLIFIFYLIIAKPHKTSFLTITILILEILSCAKLVLMILIQKSNGSSILYDAFLYVQMLNELVLPLFCIWIFLSKIFSYCQQKKQDQIKKDLDNTKLISGIKLDIDISLILNQQTPQRRIKIKSNKKVTIFQEMEKI